HPTPQPASITHCTSSSLIGLRSLALDLVRARRRAAVGAEPLGLLDVHANVAPDLREDDAVGLARLLARQELVAHVARDLLAIASERIAPAAAAAASNADDVVGRERPEERRPLLQDLLLLGSRPDDDPARVTLAAAVEAMRHH